MDEKKRAFVRSQRTAGTKLAIGPPIPVSHRRDQHDRRPESKAAVDSSSLPPAISQSESEEGLWRVYPSSVIALGIPAMKWDLKRGKGTESQPSRIPHIRRIQARERDVLGVVGTTHGQDKQAWTEDDSVQASNSNWEKRDRNRKRRLLQATRHRRAISNPWGDSKHLDRRQN